MSLYGVFLWYVLMWCSDRGVWRGVINVKSGSFCLSVFIRCSIYARYKHRRVRSTYAVRPEIGARDAGLLRKMRRRSRVDLFLSKVFVGTRKRQSLLGEQQRRQIPRVPGLGLPILDPSCAQCPLAAAARNPAVLMAVREEGMEGNECSSGEAAVGEAVRLAQEAVTADNAGDAEEAVALYSRAVDLMVTA